MLLNWKINHDQRGKLFYETQSPIGLIKIQRQKTKYIVYIGKHTIKCDSMELAKEMAISTLIDNVPK
jgi:hypothetical protein